jgi:hypothetical protein
MAAPKTETNGANKPPPPPPPPAGQGELPDPDSNSPPRPQAAPVGDIFDDLDKLRRDQSFTRVRTRKPFIACPIRKPKDHEWFQTREDLVFRGEFFRLDTGREEWYLPVGEGLAALALNKNLREVTAHAWINRKSEVNLWVVKGPDQKGRTNDWSDSLEEIFEDLARGRWIRMEAGDGYYIPEVAENDTLKSPEWPPDLDMSKVLRVALKRRVIDSLDHPVFQELTGRE